jgi:hypothetical protein
MLFYQEISRYLLKIKQFMKSLFKVSVTFETSFLELCTKEEISKFNEQVWQSSKIEHHKEAMPF